MKRFHLFSLENAATIATSDSLSEVEKVADVVGREGHEILDTYTFMFMFIGKRHES